MFVELLLRPSRLVWYCGAMALVACASSPAPTRAPSALVAPVPSPSTAAPRVGDSHAPATLPPSPNGEGASLAESQPPSSRLPSSELARLSQWVERKGGKLGVTAFDLTASRLVTSLDSDTPRNPASVSKLLTARVALLSLGLAHQFTTTYHGTLSKGHVPMLVIRSDGDPSITTSDLREVARELRLLGVESIDQGILVEQGAFEEQYVPQAFEQQPNEWAAFRAPVCATAVDRNRLTIRVFPRQKGRDAEVVVEPPGYALVDGAVKTDKSSHRDLPQVSVEAAGERVRVHLSGSIGEGAAPYVTYRRVLDPRRIVGLALGALLREQGVKVAESVEMSRTGDSTLPVLLTTKSEALPVILRRLGKDSDNFTAEMLLRAAAAKASGQGSANEGAKLVFNYLASLGSVESGTRYVNGSGLFDANRVSPSALIRLLSEVYRDGRHYPEFAGQLAIAQLDGTLKTRIANLRDRCFVRAKTGTLAKVSSLAGYLETPGQHVIAFSVIVEGVGDQASLKPLVDQWVSSLCDASLERN